VEVISYFLFFILWKIFNFNLLFAYLIIVLNRGILTYILADYNLFYNKDNNEK